MNLMSVLVQGITKFNFSPKSALEFTAMLANGVFGQSWMTSSADLEDKAVTRENDCEKEEPPVKNQNHLKI